MINKDFILWLLLKVFGMIENKEHLEQIHLRFHPSEDIFIQYSHWTKLFLEDESDASVTEVKDREDRLLRKDFNFSLETFIPSPKFLLTATGEIEQFNFEVEIA